MTAPHNLNGHPFAPVRSSPVSLFLRDHLPAWLALSTTPDAGEKKHSPDTALVLDTLARRGALFFGELVRLTGLLPSRIEQALGELVTHGWVTADSFEGLRALLVSPDKRAPFLESDRPRRHQPVTSLEYAGRWSLLRTPAAAAAPEPAQTIGTFRSEETIERFARVLLRRYGLVFRRLLEREALQASWFELSRVYRRLEARGEIRGGHFVSGVSGEQYGLPEAISLLRAIRKRTTPGELTSVSGTDPLNLVGILTPGSRIPAIATNRILLRDGVPIAALKAGEIIALERDAVEGNGTIEHALLVGKMAPALRPYYA